MKDTRSDAELNRIIAEWCRWEPTESDLRARQAWASITEPPDFYTIVPPPYCSDLNAITWVTGHCNDSQAKRWVFHLDQILRDKLREQGVPQWPDDFSRYNAGARHRAEALVAVIEEGRRVTGADCRI